MSKLGIKLQDEKLAALLEKAGFATPRAIRNATDEELREVNGVGPVTLKAIRGKLAHDAERREKDKKGG